MHVGQVTGTVAEEDALEVTFGDEVAQWAHLLVPGDQGAGLYQLLDAIKVALDDPEKAKVLHAAGIDSELIEYLERGKDDPGQYDHQAWLGLFASLEDVSGSGAFDSTSSAMLYLLDHNIRVIASKLDLHEDNLAKAEAIEKVIAAIESLADGADGEVALTNEIVLGLKELGVTSGDVSNQKLQAILDGENPENVLFSSAELKAIASELRATFADPLLSPEGGSTELLLSLKEAINAKIEIYTFISNIEAKKHQESMAMSNNIGNS